MVSGVGKGIGAGKAGAGAGVVGVAVVVGIGVSAAVVAILAVGDVGGAAEMGSTGWLGIAIIFEMPSGMAGCVWY